MTLTAQLLKPHLIIGLTGGIGSGKTVVSNWFAEQGITIVDADVIAHDVVTSGSDTLQDIQQEFGDWVITSTGTLNRQALREYVFQHPQALIALEQIMHPAIHIQIAKELQASPSIYSILSVPLLFENQQKNMENGKISQTKDLASLCQYTVVVDVPEDIQITRASSRDGQNVQHIKAIMSKQLSREKRNSLADAIINNNGTLDELYTKLSVLHTKFINMAKEDLLK